MGVEFRSIVESSPDGVVIVSREGLVTYVNAEAERLFGYSRDELLNQPMDVLVPESHRAAHREQQKAYQAQPSKRPMGKVPGIQARRRDGNSLSVDISLSPLDGGDVIVTVRDATSRIEVERELRELAEALRNRMEEASRQTRLLQSIVDSIGDGVVVLDRAGRIQLISPSALRIFPTAALDGNCPPFARVAETSGAFLPDKLTPCRVETALLAPVLEGRTVDGFEAFVRSSTSAEGAWTSMSARPLTDEHDSIVGAVITIRDTTARKSAQEAMIAGQEGERRRIARELHDSAAQSICALVLEMEGLLREIPSSSDELRRRLTAQRDGLMRLSDEISSVAHHLHPAILDRLGLAEAVEWVCGEARGKGLAVDFSLQKIPTTVSASSALCIYRIAQEGLRNVLRHAKSKNARVTLTSDGTMLNLSITDDGVGFDVEAAAAKGGLGLLSIRERVRLAGGSLHIDSQPRAGSRLEVRVPVQRQAGQHHVQ